MFSDPPALLHSGGRYFRVGRSWVWPFPVVGERGFAPDDVDIRHRIYWLMAGPIDWI